MDNNIIKLTATKYGTPCYLYDKVKIEKNISNLKVNLIEKSKLYYSMKANPLLGLCQIISKNKCGVEVASIGEMYIALKAGFLPEEIIFTGPGKTQKDLKFAISSKIKLINIENYQEALLINDLAKKNGVIMKIAIRINPTVNISTSKIKMSGISSQFGIDEECLNYTLFNNIKKLNNIELVGIQIYFGTQHLIAEDIIKNTEYIIQKALELSKKYSFKLQYLNLGGGFGVPYFTNEVELNMKNLYDGMKIIEERYKNELQETELIFESGRYIMANAGYFITKVLYYKESKDNKYIICDGGSNFHASSAFLGRFIRNNYPMYVVEKSNNAELFTITGPLCTPTDTIGQKVEISKDIDIGDYIVIQMSGAYGLTHSPIKFLSHCLPAEIIYDGNKFAVLRERGIIEDFLYGQNFFY